MRHNLFVLLCSCISILARGDINAQNDTIIDYFPEISPPEYPGGDVAIMDFFKSNIKYPKEAADSGYQGIVWISFVIEVDSSMTNVEVLRGIGGGCDEEAVRVVKEMSNWTPGKQNGKAIRMKYNIPVKFSLPSNNDTDLPKLKPGEHYDYEEIIEIAPEFPGGTKALQKFVKRHKKYPKAAKENKICGTVYISFVIDETGNISNAKILRGLGYGCDEEALRIILLMPKWIPAQTKEKPVQCYYNLAIKFGNNKSIKQ